MEFGRVGEFHGEVFVSLFGFILLAFGPEKVAEADLGERSGFAGGKLVGQALKEITRFLAVAHGVELGGEAQQDMRHQGMVRVFRHKGAQHVHRGTLFVLVPQQAGFQQQRIRSGFSSGMPGDDKITVLDGLGSGERLRRGLGLQFVLMVNDRVGDQADDHDDEEPDKLAEVVLQKLFHPGGGDFLGN